MNKMSKKCSLENHKENDSISYCTECKIYMCNKCLKLHSELFLNHHENKLDKEEDINEIFNGICQEKNHPYESNFFCKSHNKLCCGLCITKLKGKDFGQHTDCEVCLLEEIEKEKKEKLKQNLKILEELSNGLGKSIEDLKIIFEKINKNKEEIKLNIQKIFTNIRNALNEREDKLLEIVDNKFVEIFFDSNIIKEAEKMPNKIKLYLQKGKLIDNQWKDNKLNYLINSCIDIENKIKEIKRINIKIEKYGIQNINIFYNSNDKELIEKINNFGNIEDYSILFDSKIEFNHELVKSWLNNKNFSSKLLFRKTRDGSSTDDFHNKCDNKCPTIIFIETEKGYKFGGYTELKWDKKSKFKKDKSTFIFSFDNKQKYIPRNDNDTIYCDASNGPVFGSDQAEIAFENKNLNKGISYDDGKSNTFFLGRKITNGDEHWKVKEIEVFEILYK